MKKEAKDPLTGNSAIAEIKRIRAENAYKESQNQKSVEKGRKKIPQLVQKVTNLFIMNKDCFEVINREPLCYRSGMLVPVAELNAEIPLGKDDVLDVAIIAGIDFFREKTNKNLTPEEGEKAAIQELLNPRRILPDVNQMAEQLLEDGLNNFLIISVEDYGHILSIKVKGKQANLESKIGKSTWFQSAKEKDIDRFTEMVDAIFVTPGVKFKGKIVKELR